jgi:hypothetical protein
MSRKSQLRGNTIVASTASLEHSQQYIIKLFATQVGLYSYNNFNLILEREEGLSYSSTATFDELIPYLQKYNNNGWINTSGLKFDKYVKRVFRKYITDYPDRPAYLIYVCAKGRGFIGENKIMGIKDMKEIQTAGKTCVAGLVEQMPEMDADSRIKVLRALLGL